MGLNRGKVAKYGRRVPGFSRSLVLSNVSPTCITMSTQYKSLKNEGNVTVIKFQPVCLQQ